MIAILSLPILRVPLARAARALPAAVADAVAAGDCAVVLRDLPEPRADDERLAVGWCLVRTGAGQRAVAVLEGVGAGVFADYARLVGAEADLAVGEPARAAGRLEGLKLPGAAGQRVVLLDGLALAAAGDPDRAAKVVAGLAGTPLHGEGLVGLAEALATAGRTDEAAALWREVWASHVAGDLDELAADRLRARDPQALALRDPAAVGLAQRRLTSLREARQYDEALALLRQLGEAGAGSGGTALAWANFQGRDYPAAVAAYRAALGPPAQASGAPDALFHYALATSRIGDHDTAAVIYRRLIAAHPTAEEADTASFKLGYLEVDRGRCPEAVAELEAHLRRQPRSRHGDEALWFVARCRWKSAEPGARDQAVATWRRLVDAYPSSSLVPGAAYWIARATSDDAALAGVIERWPESGYAWFAAERLGRSFPAREVVPRPAWPAALAGRDDVRRAEALLAAGFRAWARDELRPVGAAARAEGRAGALAAAHALIAAGDYQGGRRLASDHCVPSWRGGDPLAQQACTPRPEAGLVAAAAAAYGLHPLVPYGIMNAESSLDPTVTSVAGARGLMQLMPAESEALHHELFGERPYDPMDLYAAPYNARMGTAELGRKLRALGDCLEGTDLPAAIAAYNGGEDAVLRWVAAGGGRPEFDEFAEDIGYTETRQYVKRVLGFAMAYRWVYGEPGRASPP